jgi:hypothetical protein
VVFLVFAKEIQVKMSFVDTLGKEDPVSVIHGVYAE